MFKSTRNSKGVAIWALCLTSIAAIAQDSALVSPTTDSLISVTRCSENAESRNSTRSPDTSPNKPTKNIFYTGEFDGFLGSGGICRKLALTPNGCQMLLDNKAKDLCAMKDKIGVLVGMGDNFGLDVLWAPLDPNNQYAARSLVDRRANPNLSINPTANPVMRLIHLAYDAIVPGKEDFAFGAGYLAAAGQPNVLPLIADNLTTQAVPSPECLSFPSPTAGLPLLPEQALTQISTSGGGSGSTGGAGASGGGGGGGPGACATAPSGPKNYSQPALFWPDAGAIYPWTVTIALSVPTGQFDEQKPVKVCAYNPNKKMKDNVSALCTNWLPVAPLTHTNAYLLNEKITRGAPPNATRILRYTLEHLEEAGVHEDGSIVAPGSPVAPAVLYPGNTVKICIKKNKSEDYVCTGDGIQVQRPLFPRAWIASRNGSTVGDYVVFGALAADTLNGVADTNRQWALPDQDPAMQVTVGDPAQAVAQALNAYNLWHPHKISTAALLAQMTPAEAKSLADSLGTESYRTEAEDNSPHTELSVILSAADVVEATPPLMVAVPLASSAPGSSGRYIPVMTPAPVFQRGDCLKPQGSDIKQCMARLSYEPNDDRATITNHPATLRDNGGPSSAPSADNTLCDSPPLPQPQQGGGKSVPKVVPAVDSWECRVLDAMRESMHDGSSRWNPDIAILEERDFDYVRSGITPDSTGTVPPLQANMALWDAGNLTRVTLLGSTLMTILTQNQTNQARNYQTLQSVRRGEQLRIRGIYQGKDGQFYVRGSILDPSKLYAVATSDNLANAGSDYPQFANQDLEFPQIFWSDNQTRMIAEVMNPQGTPMMLAKNALESAYPGQPTKNDRQQATPQVQPLAITHSNRTLFENSATPPLSQGGQLAQMEPMLRLTVQQLAAGYSLTAPSQSDQSLASNLGGVTNPNVVTPHSDSISLNYDSRVEKYLGKNSCAFCFADWGVDTQISFTRSRQGSTTQSTSQPSQLTIDGIPVPTTTVTFPGDTFIAGPFFESQINRHHYWKPVVLRPGLFSFTIATQEQFLQSLTMPPPASQNTIFPIKVRRQLALAENAGTRYERNDFNFFEFGYSLQKDFHILSAVSVAGMTPCPITSSQSLAGCSSIFPPTDGPLIPTYSTYTQNGGYLLGMFTHQLPWKTFPDGYSPNKLRRLLALYQGTAYGNFFAYGRASSSSALTHYAFAANNSIQFTLPANLTFGPNVSLFWFQANSHLPNTSLFRYSVSAQLNYSFDWHTGLPMRSTALGKVQ